MPMRNSWLLLVAGTTLLLAQTALTAQDKPKEHLLIRRVPIINDVKYELQTSEPPNLVVTVEGTVPTGGWTEVQLVRRIYETEPVDGIWEYDLLAKPPSGPATQALTKVKASDTWEKIDPQKKLKGLRVY